MNKSNNNNSILLQFVDNSLLISNNAFPFLIIFVDFLDIKEILLGRGLLKNTIIRPEKEDNPEVKKQKKKFFESQIFNMFGKSILNKGMKGESGNIESINELNESEENDVDTKDQLVDAYNNPLAINMGLGPLPLTTSIYKDEQQENKSDKNLNTNS